MISVIIPTYNRAKVIRKSIMSVLDQTISDIELIIVDDGSTDNTKQVVDEIGDDRIVYVWQQNSGACVARNKGMEVSKGEYIAFQDSDDYWHNDKLEKQIEVLKKHKDIDIVCCQTKCTRINGSYFISMDDIKDGFLSKERGPYGISTQTILMRRKVSKQVLFDKNVTRYQDLDYMLTAMEYFAVYCVPEVLVERYLGDDSITNNPEKIYSMSFYFEKKYKNEMAKGNKLSKFFSSALMNACVNTQMVDIAKYSKRALGLDNSLKTYIKYFLIKTRLISIVKW